MVYTGCWEGIAIIGGGILASLLIVAFSRRLFPADVLRDGHHATGNLLAIVGTLYAVLLGLLVVDAMVRFERAMDGVQAESNSLADIYLLAERLPAVQRAVTVFFAGLFSVANLRLQTVITGLVALVIGLNLYLMSLYGYPFAGELTVSKRPFQIDLAIFEGAYADGPAHAGELRPPDGDAPAPRPGG
jgi:hypothetical protein